MLWIIVRTTKRKIFRMWSWELLRYFSGGTNGNVFQNFRFMSRDSNPLYLVEQARKIPSLSQSSGVYYSKQRTSLSHNITSDIQIPCNIFQPSAITECLAI